jgi:mannose-6-phosphate isomerase-like protein (cupin superfamily)
MNHTFKPKDYFTVRDGTDVAPFMNGMDLGQPDLPWGSLGEMSIAAGRIGPGITSWIHLHPIVTQITYVVSGQLRVHMKSSDTTSPYQLDLQAREAAVTRPGTLLQLENRTDEAVEVLYINSPPWLYEATADNQLVYDDAVIVARTWEELEAANYDTTGMRVSADQARASRNESIRRLEPAKELVGETAHI